MNDGVQVLLDFRGELGVKLLASDVLADLGTEVSCSLNAHVEHNGLDLLDLG